MAKSTPPVTFRKLKHVLFTLVRLTLTLLLILFFPILLLGYAIILVYRLVVSKIAHFVDPKLGKMVSPLSSLFAAHDVYGNSYTINVAAHVVGKIDRFHMIHSFENLLATCVTPDGEPLYPELSQRIVTKFGYKFWKNVENFQVDNHVSYLNSENPDELVGLQEIREVIAAFGKTPLNPGRSPWQIYIVKNFKSEANPAVKSAVILRLHHVMFDGYSMLKMFGKLADNGPLVLAGSKSLADEARNQPSPQWRISKWLHTLLKMIITLFRGPYESVGQLMSYDDNELIQTNRKNFTNVMRYYECEPIPLDELKAIKNFYRVSMTTLITTLVIRGLKTMLEKRKICTKKIHMTFPLPVFNHPDKLRNYFSGGIISFDMTHDDPLKLLQSVEKKYYQFRFAFAYGLPKISMLFLRILGSLPVFLTPRIDNVPLSSTIMHSSFPGPVDVIYFCGFPIVDATVGGSISKPYPTGTLCFSYNGIYKIAVSGDACIFKTQDEAEEMGNAIYQEFVKFTQKIKENVV